mgnify:CR=1 FL=1
MDPLTQFRIAMVMLKTLAQGMEMVADLGLAVTEADVAEVKETLHRIGGMLAAKEDHED